MDVIKDKDILLEKMLDPGASLSDEELELILHDEELREIYEVSVAVSSAATQPTVIDVDEEWRLFRHKLHPKPSRWRWAMRVAAIFLGVLFVGAIVRTAVDHAFSGNDTPVTVAESKPSAPPRPLETAGNGTPLPTVEETPETAPIREATPRKRVRTMPVPELTEEEEIEVDEYLRLQQARIDNDFAMIQAELYVDQLQALDVPDLATSSAEPDGLYSRVSRITVMP